MKIRQKLAIGFIRTKIRLLGAMSTRKAAEEAFRLFSTPMMKTASNEKQVYNQAEPLQFLLNGNRVSGYRCNHPQEKKVLLLHGFSSSVTNFYRYVDPLVQKDYEVLAFNAPAHGSSEGKTVNAVDYSEMIKKVVELYGPFDAFLGHSFGGIAISLALETIPHDRQTKVVLIAPATETVSAIDGAFEMIGIKKEKIRKAFDEIIYEKSGKAASWFSIRRAMHNIKASILWIHDEADDVTPLSDALKVQADNHPNIRFMITKGLGHRKIYRDEKVIQSIMEFL